MAKMILSFFGGLSILVGVVLLVVAAAAFDKGGAAAMAITLPAAAGCLIAGAPLLGFARVIELLERIARNTGGAASGNPSKSRIDPVVEKFMQERAAAEITVPSR